MSPKFPKRIAAIVPVVSMLATVLNYLGCQPWHVPHPGGFVSPLHEFCETSGADIIREHGPATTLSIEASEAGAVHKLPHRGGEWFELGKRLPSQVSLDGVPWPDSVGDELVAPGPHEVRIRAAGFIEERTRFTVVRGVHHHVRQQMFRDTIKGHSDRISSIETRLRIRSAFGANDRLLVVVTLLVLVLLGIRFARRLLGAARVWGPGLELLLKMAGLFAVGWGCTLGWSYAYDYATEVGAVASGLLSALLVGLLGVMGAKEEVVWMAQGLERWIERVAPRRWTGVPTDTRASAPATREGAGPD